MNDETVMKAVIVRTPGGAENLQIEEWARPVPIGKEILVKIEAAGVNRADILQRQGKYPPPSGATPILGLEVAGRVAGMAAGATRWKEGDAVFGLLPGGGYAEYAVMHEDMAMPIPKGISIVQAAAIPEVFLTAFQSVVWLGKLKAKEHILIHAGASGVGTAAIQLSRAQEARVIVTASAQKHQACRNLGAELAIDYAAGPFVVKVQDFTNGRGVDVIIDFIAGPYFEQNIECLKTDGRLILLASLGGGKIESFDLRKILTKRLMLIGSTLRSRPPDYQIMLTKEFAALALPLFPEGTLKPVVDKVFNWHMVSDAHRYMEANKNIGKIVLEIGA